MIDVITSEGNKQNGRGIAGVLSLPLDQIIVTGPMRDGQLESKYIGVIHIDLRDLHVRR